MGRLKDLIKEHLFTIIKILLLVLMIGVIAFSIEKEIKSINIAETLMLIKSFSVFKILLLIMLGVVAIAIITLYDFIIIRYLKLDIKPLNIFTISYVATTINNVSPLGNVAGASIRAIFFKKGDNNTDVLDYNLLFMPATGIGLSLLLVVALINNKYIAPLYNQYRLLIIAIVWFLGYLLLYFFIDKLFYIFKKTKVDVNNRQRNIVKLKLLMSSTLAWIVAFILFSTIIRHFNQDISPIIILGIFVLSTMAGIITMLPGGVGSFDLIALVGFQSYGVSSEHVLASLVLYRVFYFIVPLVISIIFTLIIQGQNDKATINIWKTKKIQVFVNRTSKLSNLLQSRVNFLRASKNSFFRKSMSLDWFWVFVSSIGTLIGLVIYMKLSNKIHLDYTSTIKIKELFIKGLTSFKPKVRLTYGS